MAAGVTREPTHEARAFSWTIRAQAKARCVSCGAWSSVQGPDGSFDCRVCRKANTIGPNDWQEALSLPTALGHSWSVPYTVEYRQRNPEEGSAAFRVMLSREVPECPACTHPLSMDKLFEKSRCQACNVRIPLVPLEGPSARIKWVLRVPPDPHEDETIAEREAALLAHAKDKPLFDPDPSRDIFDQGDHVPGGVFWLGMRLDVETLAKTKVRVEQALEQLDAVLEDDGLTTNSLPQPVARLQALDPHPDERETESSKDKSDLIEGLVGCVLIIVIAALGGLFVGALLIAFFAVVLLVAL